MKITWFLINKRMRTENKYVRKACSLFIQLTVGKGNYIGGGSKFLGKPTFPHGINGIFIYSGATIGANAVIFHQVTIGSNTTANSSKNGSPTIGDNCYIGAGAKIIGKINIGDNVRIGANCVVVKDIPDNCVVVNQPARVIVKENLSNEFKKFQSN